MEEIRLNRGGLKCQHLERIGDLAVESGGRLPTTLPARCRSQPPRRGFEAMTVAGGDGIEKPGARFFRNSPCHARASKRTGAGESLPRQIFANNCWSKTNNRRRLFPANAFHSATRPLNGIAVITPRTHRGLIVVGFEAGLAALRAWYHLAGSGQRRGKTARSRKDSAGPVGRM